MYSSMRGEETGFWRDVVDWSWSDDGTPNIESFLDPQAMEKLDASFFPALTIRDHILLRGMSWSNTGMTPTTCSNWARKNQNLMGYDNLRVCLNGFWSTGAGKRQNSSLKLTLLWMMYLRVLKVYGPDALFGAFNLCDLGGQYDQTVTFFFLAKRATYKAHIEDCLEIIELVSEEKNPCSQAQVAQGIVILQ